jgi:SagB-type dehydrogenase family enzyme
LEFLSGKTPEVVQLLGHAGMAAGMLGEAVQVLLIFTARFKRLAYKYERLAYSLILKEAGVLMQNMYLAATAMDLAPCALGTGDSDLFVRAVRGDYTDETSIGEFLLGSTH